MKTFIYMNNILFSTAESMEEAYEMIQELRKTGLKIKTKENAFHDQLICHIVDSKE